MENKGSWRRVYVVESNFKLPEYTWDKDREKCLTCAHLVHKDPAMYCNKIKELLVRQRKDRQPTNTFSCIEMRTKGLCGKNARYWKARE